MQDPGKIPLDCFHNLHKIFRGFFGPVYCWGAALLTPRRVWIVELVLRPTLLIRKRGGRTTRIRIRKTVRIRRVPLLRLWSTQQVRAGVGPRQKWLRGSGNGKADQNKLRRQAPRSLNQPVGSTPYFNVRVRSRAKYDNDRQQPPTRMSISINFYDREGHFPKG